MAIDIENEVLLGLTAATGEFPGRRVCRQTLGRWASPPGVRGAILETVVIGGQRYTSREAISRFCASQNPSVPTTGVSAKLRVKRSAAARLELVKLGVLPAEKPVT